MQEISCDKIRQMLTEHFKGIEVASISMDGKFLYLNITGARKIRVAKYIFSKVDSLGYVCFDGWVFTRTTVQRYGK